MAALLHQNNQPQRINPFLFPADTTFRFVLLMVSVISASLFVYNTLSFRLNIQTQKERATRCRTDVYTEAIKASSRSEADYAKFLAADKKYSECTAPYELAKVGWQLGGVGSLLAVAGVIYFAVPFWTIRRGGLIPLTAADHPELLPYLHDLSAEVGLARTPRFLWNPISPTSGGLAFGRLGHYYVRLNGGLVQQFYTDRPTFRSIMLHELAHLRNADIDKTYFSVAVAAAFVLAVVAPYFVYLLHTISDIPWEEVVAVTWRVLALALLVYLTLASILRTREVYADARAAQWDNSTTRLGRLFGGGPAGDSVLARFRAIWRFHPRGLERRQVLEEPERLFRMGFWEALITGVATSIAVDSLTTFLFSLQQGLQQSATIYKTIGALIFATLAVGITGSGVWRATFLARERDSLPPGVLRLGLGLGLGIIVGRLVSFQSISFGLDTTPHSLAYWSEMLIEAAVLFAILFLFLGWVAASARAWLQVTPRGVLPRRSYAASLLIAGLGLSIWSGALLQNEVLRSAVPLGMGASIFLQWLVLPRELILLMLLSLWVLPLAAALRGPRGSASNEGRTVRLRHVLGRLRSIPSQFPVAFRAGLIGGVSVLVIHLSMRIFAHRFVPDSVRAKDDFALGLYLWEVERAVGVQIIVGIVVAGLARRLGAIQALLAAFIAGSVTAAVYLGANTAASCVPVISLRPSLGCPQGVDLSFAWSLFRDLVSGGGLLAVLVAVIAGQVAGRFRVAVRYGIFGGLAFCALWLPFVIAVRFATADASFNRLSDAAFIGLAVLLQAGVASLTVVKIERWRILHGLVAAVVVACVAFAAYATVNLSVGMGFDLGSVIEPLGAFGRALGIGLALVIPLVLIEALVFKRFRRTDGRAMIHALTQVQEHSVE